MKHRKGQRREEHQSRGTEDTEPKVCQAGHRGLYGPWRGAIWMISIDSKRVDLASSQQTCGLKTKETRLTTQ